MVYIKFSKRNNLGLTEPIRYVDFDTRADAVAYLRREGYREDFVSVGKCSRTYNPDVYWHTDRCVQAIIFSD